MKKIIFSLMLFSGCIYSQNIFDTTGDARLDGTTLKVIAPNDAPGGWARGLEYYSPDRLTRVAAIGLRGSGNPTVYDYMYFAHGSEPWISGLGLYVRKNGNIGVGLNDPSVRLHVKGRIRATNYISVTKGSSYTIAMNGTNHGYLTGRNSSFEDKFLINSNGVSYLNGGNVGIGTTNPEGNLQIGKSTGNGMIFLGGGKGYSGIGSTRSDGGLALGCNIYSRYNSDDYSVARVSQSNDNGFSGIKLSRNGEIDFFGKKGAVAFDQVANSSQNIKMRIAKNGNVGIGALNPGSHNKLEVINSYAVNDNPTRNGIYSSVSTKTISDVTSFDKGIFANAMIYDIPVGVKDSGYKIGIDASAFSDNVVFKGTLATNRGIWARGGIYKASPGARVNSAVGADVEVLSHAQGAIIDNAYGVKINTARSTATTVTNKYDLYAQTPDAKNYFAGTLGIGTTNMSDSTGDYRLSVKGKVRANEIKVYTGWADFVFEKDYNLPTLKEVEEYIKEKGHLKDIPDAKEVEENGVYLGEINAKLLQKIEELTLYTIQQEKDNTALQKRIEKLEMLLEKLINQ